MHRRALLLPVLVLALLPAGASACDRDEHYVDTLGVSVSAPSQVRVGAPSRVTAAVTRGGAAAADVEVHLRLEHGDEPASYGSGRTGVDGRTDLVAVVPRARGPWRVTVEAFRPVVAVECYGRVVEHGLTRTTWGRTSR